MVQQQHALSLESRPYRWPYHGAFAPGRTGLIVCIDDVDIPVPSELARVSRALREHGGVTVLMPRAGMPGVDVVTCDAVVDRVASGGFTGTSLAMVLRSTGVTDVIVAGLPFEIGADCTMRQANDLGFECLALEDCSSGLACDTFAGAMSSIQMSGGIFGAVARSAEVLQLIERWRVMTAIDGRIEADHATPG